MTCPAPVELEAYLELPPDRQSGSSVEDHLNRCGECQTRVRRVLLGHSHTAADAEAAPADAPPPAVEGYTLVSRLGAGGMGEVWKAVQAKPSRVVAVKFLAGRYRHNRDAQKRFLAEPEAVARFQQPNIVQIFEARVDSAAGAFFTMELLEGGTLRERLAGRPVSPARAAELVRTLGRAAAHAHDRGIVHRDLKPANVLFAADGTPKLTDFGLAKLTDAADPPTIPGQVLGTPEYMSPEQTRDSAVGPTADVYSLGVILYECLTGRTPFRGVDAADTLALIRASDPVAPRRLVASVPVDLETICLKSLEKEPAGRYPSAAALADDLDRFLRHEPVHARPLGPLARFARSVRRRPVVSGLAALLAVVVVVAGIAIWGQADRANQAATDRRLAEVRAEERVLAAEERRKQEGATAVERQRAQDRFRRELEYNFAAFRLQSIAELPGTGGLGNNYLSVLEKIGSTSGEDDLRGFEWHYWRTKLAPQQTVRLSRDAVAGRIRLAVRPHGRELAIANGRSVRLWDPQGPGPPVLLPAEIGPIAAVDYAPKLPLLALAGDGGRVRLWDLDAGRVVRTLEAPAGRLQAVAFDPTGLRVAAADDKGRGCIWDLSGDGRVPLAYTQQGFTQRLQFSPDGATLFGVFGDGVRAWAAATGRAAAVPGLVTPKGRNVGINDGVLDPRGAFLYSAHPTGGVWRHRLLGDESAAFVEHKDAALAVAASPDGGLVATAGRDHGVRLCDATSGYERKLLLGHTDMVHSVAFGPDSSWLASAGEDGRVCVWSVAPSPHVASWPAPALWSVAVSRDGRLGASAERDGKVTVWDLATRTAKRAPWPAHGERAFAVSFSPDGTLLATAGIGMAKAPAEPVKVWLVKTGESVSGPSGGPDGIRSVAFAPDGKRLACGGSDGRVHICDWPDGPWRVDPANPPKREVMALAFSPDGRRVASAGADNRVRLWDAATARMLPAPDEHGPHTQIVYGVAFDHTGWVLASVGLDQKVKFWNLATNKPIASHVSHGAAVRSVAFDHATNTFVTAGDDGAVRRWTASGKQELAPLGGHYGKPISAAAAAAAEGFVLTGGAGLSLWDATRLNEPGVLTGHVGAVEALSFSPDGRVLASPGWDGTVRVWDTKTERLLQTIAHPDGGKRTVATATAFSPDGNTLATAGNGGTVHLWDATDPKAYRHAARLLEPGRTPVFGLAFSPDGRRLATGGEQVRVIDVERRAVIHSLPAGVGVNQVAFHADGKRLAAACIEVSPGGQDAGSVRLWNAETGKELWVAREDGKTAHGVVVGSDFVAAAFADKNGSNSTARIWDLDGRERTELRATGFHFYSIALSADGRRLATGQKDGSVRVWHPGQAVELLTLRGHTSSVYSVAFAPDGKTLASASADGTIRLWRGGGP